MQMKGIARKGTGQCKNNYSLPHCQTEEPLSISKMYTRRRHVYSHTFCGALVEEMYLKTNRSNNMTVCNSI